jgi:hypothetical protein
VKRVLPLRRGEAVEDVVRANRPLIEVRFNIVGLLLNEADDHSALVFWDSGGGFSFFPPIFVSLLMREKNAMRRLQRRQIFLVGSRRDDGRRQDARNRGRPARGQKRCL